MPGRFERATVTLSKSRKPNALRRAFGSRVKMFREQHGWTQQHLADLAEVSRTHVTEIEGGRRAVNLETLHRLATAFDLTAAKLLDDLL